MKVQWASSNATRDRVLDAALLVFRERGYSDCTMADIVEAAGVSIGSIYHHFGGKDELFNACFIRLRTHLRESIGLADVTDMPEPGTWEVPYLWAVWSNDDACAVFLGSDTPKNFEPVMRVAEYYSELRPYAYRILAAILLESMRILCDSTRAEAEEVIGSTIKLLNVVRAIGFRP